MKGPHGSAFLQLTPEKSVPNAEPVSFMISWNHPFGSFPSSYSESHITSSRLNVEHRGNETGHCQIILWEVTLKPESEEIRY